MGVQFIQTFRFGGWTPAALTDLVAWWDADEASAFTFSSGSSVSQWNDLSGNGKHLVQATSSRQPTRNGTQNSRTTVTFDGGDFMSSSATLAFGVFTIYIVAKFAAGVQLAYEHSANSNSNPGSYLNPSTGASIQVTRGAGGSSVSSGDATANWGADSSFHTFVQTFDGTDAGHTLHKDGTTVSASTGGGSANPGTSTATDTFYLGARSGLVAPILSGGAIGTVLVCNTAHNSTTRATVLDYLKARWGTP